ncbi:orotidine-5'-phosphate decarboxylase [Thermodesulfobacteriota bacterium]
MDFIIKKPHDYIVFPLDMPEFDRVTRYVELLKGHVGLFKVGLELFISQGPDILKAINEIAENKIFLDLKLHDIPATVTRSFLAASAYGAEFVTIHCDMGEGFLKEVAVSNPGNTKLLAVTVLTSLNRENLRNLGHEQRYIDDLSQMVLLKARIAREAGCHGIVCSGKEVSKVRGEFGSDFIIVAPGIRPAWASVNQDDQKRIVTPAQAVEAGADFIVVGRPIRDDSDPVKAAERIAEEIASVL